MELKSCSINGTIAAADEAVVSAFNIEYSYGFGVYENIRVSHGAPLFLSEHIQRLAHSAQIIGVCHPWARKTIEGWARALAAALPSETYNLKILLIGGSGVAATKKAQLVILPLAPFFPKKEWYQQGVATITAAYERPFPQAKTLSMLQSYLAYKKAAENGCYDALAVDSKGYIREGTRSNFFLIKGRTIYRSPKELILDGVTQRMVVALARRHRFTVVERLMKKQMLARYDGAFLTSTSAKIVPIRRIDGFVFPNIPSSLKELMTLFEQFLHLCILKQKR